jgi:cytochrome c556
MSHSRQFVCGALLAFTTLTISTPSMPAERPEDAIKFRRAAYSVIGWKFDQLVAMAKGVKPFDKDEFLRNASLIEQLSKAPIEGFTAGADKGDTRAKPEIWTNMSDFKTKTETMQLETSKLITIAKAGNLADVKAQVGKVGASCKACHDEYRQK